VVHKKAPVTTSRPGKTTSTVVVSWRDRFKANLAKRFFLRLHMSLILMTTGLAGFLTNRILLWAGVWSMPLRYALSIVVAYSVFMLCFRLWLRYVSGRTSPRPAAADDPRAVDVAGEVIDGAVDGLRSVGHRSGAWLSPSGADGAGTVGKAAGEAAGEAAEGGFWETSPESGSGSAAAGTFWHAGEAPAMQTGQAAAYSLGDMGGAGGGDLTEPGDQDIGTAAAAFFVGPEPAGDGLDPGGGSAGGSGGGFDLDVDVDDVRALVAIVALAVIVLVVCGAGIYLIWEAPAILSDAAFQVVMTWAVRRKAGEIDDAAWVGSVAKATMWPWVIIAVMTIGIGAGVQAAYPDVHSLGQLLNR
jgi:hypothetical protein